MGEETRKRVGKLYREGYFKDDPVAAQWAEEYPEEEVVEEKPKPKKKGKK